MVKFSHSINLNASPDWRDHYLSYSRLKKITYVLEKAVLGVGSIPLSLNELDEMVVLDGGVGDQNGMSNSVTLTRSPADGGAVMSGAVMSGVGDQKGVGEATDNQDEDDEKMPLLGPASHVQPLPPTPATQTAQTTSSTTSRRRLNSAPAISGGLAIDRANAFFISALDAELDKICRFYGDKEGELVEMLHEITLEISKQERNEESYLHSLWATSSSSTTSATSAAAAANHHKLNLNALHMGNQIIAGPGSASASHYETGRLSPTIGQSMRLGAAATTTNANASPSSVMAAGKRVGEEGSLVVKAALDQYDTLESGHGGGGDAVHVDMQIQQQGHVLHPQPSFLPYLIWSSPSLKHTRNGISKRLTHLFVLFCDLRDYVDINETGFSKVLKKYEKVVGGKVKQQYMGKVERGYPFLVSTKNGVKESIERLVAWYARIAADGKIQVATSDLKAHLREHIVWERNTIWRDMVEQERRSGSIGFVAGGGGGGSAGGVVSGIGGEMLLSGIHVDQRKGVVIEVCGVGVWVPRVIPASVLATIAAIGALIILTMAEIFPTAPMNNCFAILVFASIMWAFEAIPLFVTSMCIPVLVVLLKVMVDVKTGEPMDAKNGAKRIFSEMFGPVIMLLLGGFSLAAALSKHNIAKSLASMILSRAGSKPHWVLLCNMFVSTFASMWISNVAAPVLCFSLIGPILRNLPRKSTYARCLVLGIAMAANVGGMASPIASPQNVIAMGILDKLGAVSWLQWFIIALPMAVALDLLICLLLLAIYRPAESAMPPEITGSASSGLSFTLKQWFVLAVSIVTILLWCGAASMEKVVGDMGVIAVLPIVVFYGAGILTKDDWNSMLWSVVMLAMGGISLGKAVESSGLLHELASNLTPLLKNLSPFYCVALLSGIVVVVTSFISHTVGALIILPVVLQIGEMLPDPRPKTLVMATCLMCSGGMALPVSSFPNMNAISLEDSRGEAWLSVSDFLGIGVASSFIAWVAVLVMGYPIMTLIGLDHTAAIGF